jgi:predicted CoA-binding protein
LAKSLNTDELVAIYQNNRNIAVVGLSGRPDRPSYGVSRYLIDIGYNIIPVNPNQTEVLGLKSYPDLQSVPEKVDIVQVFRRPEHLPPIARDAVAIGAKVLWMQTGIINQEAADIAESAGLQVVMDLCLGATHYHFVQDGIL